MCQPSLVKENYSYQQGSYTPSPNKNILEAEAQIRKAKKKKTYIFQKVISSLTY